MAFLTRFTLMAVLIFGAAAADAMPPIEAYGDLPTMRSVSVGPDGNRVAYFSRNGGKEGALVYDLPQDKILGGVGTDKIKARSVYFIKPNYAVLVASDTLSVYGYRGRFEFSGAFAYNIEKEQLRLLLKRNEELYPAQGGLGRIVGVDPTDDYVYMPAYIGKTSALGALFRVNLETGKGRIAKRGTEATVDWFLDSDGDVVAREDFDDKRNIYSLYYYEKDSLTVRKIYEEKTRLRSIGLVGVKPDRSKLIVSLSPGDSDTYLLAEMDLDGNISEPIFQRQDRTIEGLVTGLNRTILGVRFAGLLPTYEFFDAGLQSKIEGVQSFFPDAAVHLVDWSSDFKKMAFSVAGGATAPTYYLYDAESNRLRTIGSRYNGIDDKDVGQVLTIEYKARDGEKIPSVLTLPPGWQPGKKRPTIIMPHGGPEAYDTVGFDWMAQFFANRGYIVLQPNFRGSAGFGQAFTSAGHGEWGKGVMQHDVTDGVQALIKGGYADPERICIIGASYGGYAALAGGAFTPDLYQCVAAIAPVADLPLMLIDEKRDSGSSSWVLDYWQRFIGDLKTEREKLKSISPSEHANAFQAPVLLIHGNDDTVVPLRQSVRMERALKQAGKEVTLVRLKGEDHWLSTGETRIETLRALDQFVARTLGGHQAQKK